LVCLYQRRIIPYYDRICGEINRRASAPSPIEAALERYEDHIKQWVEERWPEKKAREGGSELVFLDENR